MSEELSDSVARTTRSRFLWLFVNLITAFVASSVLGLFENELQKMGACRARSNRREPGRQCRDATMTVAVRAIGNARCRVSNAFASSCANRW